MQVPSSEKLSVQFRLEKGTVGCREPLALSSSSSNLWTAGTAPIPAGSKLLLAQTSRFTSKSHCERRFLHQNVARQINKKSCETLLILAPLMRRNAQNLVFRSFSVDI